MLDRIGQMMMFQARTRPPRIFLRSLWILHLLQTQFARRPQQSRTRIPQLNPYRVQSGTVILKTIILAISCRVLAQTKTADLAVQQRVGSFDVHV